MFRRLSTPPRVAALLLAVTSSALALPVSAQVVISQAYGGGGNNGSTYKQDFIELFNRGATPVDLSGHAVQYASATGSSWQVTNLTGVTLQPGQYYLVAQALGAGGTVDLPTPDVTGTIPMGGTAFKVALTSTTTALTGTCPTTNVIDFVGAAANANCFEGTAPAPAPSAANAVVRGSGGCTDAGDNATDFTATLPTPRNTATAANPCGGGTPDPVVSFDSGTLTVAEGNPPNGNALVFRVGVSPAPTGTDTVTFDVAVTGAAGRYTYSGPTSVTIDENTTLPVELSVDTIPNLVTDGDATVTVSLSNFTGTAASQTSPLDKDGTIADDDLAFDPIHAIQGSGQNSPVDGDVVTTRGIVTGLRTNAFYIQTPDADIDADPATSEGLYVFVGNAANMPAGLAVGDLVYVQGTVDEYVPAADPNQLPITELVAPITVTPIASAQPLPAPIALNPDPDGALDQLERYESMRVSVADYTVTSPTADFADESFGVVTGTPRPFREEGVDEHDCGVNLPAEAPANVPCWDANPELLRMKTNLLVGGAAIPLRTGTRLTNVVGVLDYAFRRYSILTRQAEPFTIVPGTEATGTAAAVPTSTELTIGGFNVENLALAANATYERKASKITTTLIDYMHTPDIVGFIEVASLATLEDIAQRVNTAAANDPEYTAQMVSLSGTQRLGFLVKNSEVRPGVPRVEIGAIEEFGADLHVICPDGVSQTVGLLNDRAPLVMDVVVNAANGAAYPMTVINNHLKSLIGVDSLEDADADYACFNDPQNPGGGEGRRNRAKRQQNAEYLAELVDDLQTQNPGRPIVLVGDFNAFQFNDGYADLMNTVAGTPAANDTTVVPGDGVDLVDPDLINLTDLVEDEERYSYVFEGNAQVLDHILVNEGVVATTQDFRRETPRVNADFTTADAGNAAVPFGNSDHDPAVGYLDVTAFHTADLVVGFNASNASANVGDVILYGFAVENSGPDTAFDTTVTFDLPAGVGFVSANAPGSWTCNTPAVGQSGDIVCTSPALGADGPVLFSVQAEVLPAAAGSTQTATLTAGTASTDPSLPNTASVDTVVAAANIAPVFDPDTYAFTTDADVVPGTPVGSVTATDADGDTLTFTITAGNTDGAFAIDAAGLITVANSAALTEGASFLLTVQASDPDGATANATVMIDVAFGLAFDAASYTFSIDADAADGSEVGTVSATHGGGDTLVYGFDGAPAGLFAIDAGTGVITLVDASLLGAGPYNFTVTATDEDGRFVMAPVTVNVIAEPPGSEIFSDGFED